MYNHIYIIISILIFMHGAVYKLYKCTVGFRPPGRNFLHLIDLSLSVVSCSRILYQCIINATMSLYNINGQYPSSCSRLHEVISKTLCS